MEGLGRTLCTTFTGFQYLLAYPPIKLDSGPVVEGLDNHVTKEQEPPLRNAGNLLPWDEDWRAEKPEREQDCDTKPIAGYGNREAAAIAHRKQLHSDCTGCKPKALALWHGL